MSEPKFKPIALEDRAIIQAHTLKATSQICDLAFSNLYGWRERYQTSWAIVEHSLVISFWSKQYQHPAYLMPVCQSGEAFKSVVSILRKQAEEGGYPLVLMGISPYCKEAIEEYCPDCFTYLHSSATQDYVYLREKLVSLSGKSLQSKRNHINKFEKLYPDWLYEEISDASLEECLSLARLWLSDEEQIDSSKLDEQKMIELCLSNREALDLQTGLLRVGGRVIAFSFGSPINSETFGIHVEKADIHYEGAFTMINREFARRIPEQYTYINREEDLGLEGLRKSKQSYKPERLLIKDTAVLKL